METEQSSMKSTELEHLRSVNARTGPARLLGYARLSGPGWIQGAITLGASTATSGFYLGWKFGYQINIVTPIIKSTSFNTRSALNVISSKFPIGVGIKISLVITQIYMKKG